MSYRDEALETELHNLDSTEQYWFKQGIIWADAHPTLKNHTRIVAQTQVAEYPMAYDFNYEDYCKRNIAREIGNKLLEDGLLEITSTTSKDGLTTTYKGELIVFNPEKEKSV